MWSISLLTTMFLLPLLSAAPLDIAGDIKEEDVKDDNDGMHSHDENVTRGGKFFGHNRFDMGDMNISGSVAGDVVSIGHEVKIDVHGHTHDHHHHEADTVIECKEGFRELFKSIDSNKNGLMDAKELLRVCHQNNIKITKPLAVRILTLPDKTVGFNMAKFCDLLKDCPNTNSADIIHFLLQLFDKVAGCSRDEIEKFCSCPRDYDPVCAGGRLYNNLCLHSCARKEAECADVQAIPAVGNIAECVDPSTKGIVNRDAIKKFQMTLHNIEHELANLVNSRRKRDGLGFTEEQLILLNSIEKGYTYLDIECSNDDGQCHVEKIEGFIEESKSSFTAVKEAGSVSSERGKFDKIADVAGKVQEKTAVKRPPQVPLLIEDPPLLLGLALPNYEELTSVQASPPNIPDEMHNIRRLLSGYDIMKGNPLHVDLSLPVDPGFRLPIFEASYQSGSMTADRRYLQPDGTTISSCIGSCSLKFESTEISGSKSYQESLAKKVGLSVGGSIGAWGGKFSASVGYKEVAEKTSSDSNLFTLSSASCCAYSAEILSFKHPSLSQNFRDGVETLTEKYDEKNYLNFIEAFGTHFIRKALMGALYGQQTEISREAWITLQENGIDISTAAELSAYGVTADFSKKAEDQKTFTIGVKPPTDGDKGTWLQKTISDPAPIELALGGSILDLLEHDDIKAEVSTAIRANLKKALDNYCNLLLKSGEAKTCSSPGPDPAFPSPASGCVEKFEYDTDYKGGDVPDGANVKSNNKEDCRNMCRNKPGCNFWTFVKSWRNNCLLKYSSEGKEPHSGYVSGNICKGGHEQTGSFTLDGGSQGFWGSPQYCTFPHIVNKMQLRWQGDVWKDDSALNGIQLTCTDGRLISSSIGSAGSWRGTKECAPGFFINSVKLRADKASSKDVTAANGIRFKCDDGVEHFPEDGYWGLWTSWHSCPQGSYIYGIQTQIDNGGYDITGLNDVIFFCAKLQDCPADETLTSKCTCGGNTCPSGGRCASGSRCIPGNELRLYEHVDEAGRSLTLYRPTNLQLRNFNNVASSVHAVKGDWELYIHSDYSGNRMVVKQGQKINTDREDEYSSARPICKYHDDPSTAKLKVYERVSSQGEEKEFLNEERDLDDDWSKKISSVHVLKGDWELYEHKNYHGVREVVKEGDQIDIQHKDLHSSLRPICETYTYTPKCTPVRIEILDDPKSTPKFKETKIIGAVSGFSCNDPSTNTLTLNSVRSVTNSISLGTSKSEGTDWSVGGSATITGKVGFLGSGTEVSATISGSTGGSTSVTHEETDSSSTEIQTLLGKSTEYPTPGAAILFGSVDLYEVDNPDLPVKIHLDCNGKMKERLSTMKLTGHIFQFASFFSFVKEIDNAGDCDKDGFYSKIDNCIRNVKAKYINRFAEKEKMRKDFNDCFA